MKKLNISYFKLSVIISIFLPMFIPSAPIVEDILKYNYGLPLSYITIYQERKTSVWFFYNFFNGNSGILLNPLNGLINIGILYFIIILLTKLFKRNQKKN